MANRKVQLLVAGPDLRIITTNGELIRALTLDPTRNYQPLGGRWPVHNVLQQASSMSRDTTRVAPAGFEPAISALRGLRPRPLDDGAAIGGRRWV